MKTSCRNLGIFTCSITNHTVWVEREWKGRMEEFFQYFFSVSFNFPFLLLFLNFPFALVIDIQNKQQINRWSSFKCSKNFFLDLSISSSFSVALSFPLLWTRWLRTELERLCWTLTLKTSQSKPMCSVWNWSFLRQLKPLYTQGSWAIHMKSVIKTLFLWFNIVDDHLVPLLWSSTFSINSSYILRYFMFIDFEFMWGIFEHE